MICWFKKKSAGFKGDEEETWGSGIKMDEAACRAGYYRGRRISLNRRNLSSDLRIFAVEVREWK